MMDSKIHHQTMKREIKRLEANNKKTSVTLKIENKNKKNKNKNKK